MLVGDVGSVDGAKLGGLEGLSVGRLDDGAIEGQVLGLTLGL